MHIINRDWLFLFLSLGLGFLAEISFLHGTIGLSYLMFIFGFYIVFFYRFRLAFQHRRIGLLFMASIWLLSLSYVLYDNQLFYVLNLIVIPVLVLTHIILITRPNTFKWHTPRFIMSLILKLDEARQYSLTFCRTVFNKTVKHLDQRVVDILKRVILGLVIGIPLLCVITLLLISADSMFENVIGALPQFIFRLNFLEAGFRILFVLFVGLLFFGVFQTLYTNRHISMPPKKRSEWHSITAITILVMLNAVYLLFAVVQFKYFFNHDLVSGETYADAARRGFFELVIVTLINWTVLISFLKRVKPLQKKTRLTLNILYSILILVSGIMLASAYERLSLYESAYGFTTARILAHVFMIFLMVIFAYTLIKVWIEHISLIHFYLIVGLIFYTALNVANIEKVIVDQNIKRFEATGKVDLDYLNSLSYTGLDGLIQLYDMPEDIPELRGILKERQQMAESQPKESWQSFNFTKQNVLKKLKTLNLE